jgi:hypothetical protein
VKLAELGRVFAMLGGSFGDVLNSYTDDQLVLITGFVNRLTAEARAAIAGLNKASESAESGAT